MKNVAALLMGVLVAGGLFMQALADSDNDNSKTTAPSAYANNGKLPQTNSELANMGIKPVGSNGGDWGKTDLQPAGSNGHADWGTQDLSSAAGH